MKKLLLLFSLFIFCTISTVFAEPEYQKIAVIDIQKVVSSSAQVKALNAARDSKNKDLILFIKKAQDDINKQTDETKRKNLSESYEKQIKEKREANLKEYTAKLKVVDANIISQIGQKAAELGYTMVLPKSVVVWNAPGNDITEDIIKVIK